MTPASWFPLCRVRAAPSARTVRPRPFAFSAVVLASLFLTACQPYHFKGTEYLDASPAPDFELIRDDGGTLRLSDQKGKVVLFFFGFTSCPDVCPTTLADAKRVLLALGDQASRVTYLFITVDPERDTPAVLDRYVGLFHPAIIGLTGSPEVLAQVWEDYGIVAEKVALEGTGGGYTITHTVRLFVVDAENHLRLSYGFGTPYEDILEDIRQLILRSE
jgi:protein SCO1/2